MKENPAERLYSLISEALKDDSDRHAIAIWSEALGVGEYKLEAEGKVVARFGELIKLYEDTRDSLEAIEDLDQELFLSWGHPIRNLLFYSKLYLKWSSQRELVKPEALQALRFCADRLRREPGFPEVVDEAAIQSLYDQASKVALAIADADLPDRVKDKLLRFAGELLEALDEYRIRGVQRLVEASEVVAGGFLLHWREIGPHQQEEPVRDTLDLWRTIVDVASLAGGVKLLAEAAEALLGP